MMFRNMNLSDTKEAVLKSMTVVIVGSIYFIQSTNKDWYY